MAELTPGDNNNEKEQENENVIEASDQDQQPEPTPNLEPAEAAVMVGLDKDNFGAAAPTSDEINAAQNAQNQQSGPSAQDLANHQQNEDSIFTASPHSNDAAMAQINLGLQGIEGQVDGVIGATLQQNQIEEEKAKKERERIIVANSGFENMEEFAQAVAAQGEKLNALAEKAQAQSVEAQETSNEVNERVEELKELAAQHEQELQELKDRGASQEEINAKQLELDTTNNLIDLLENKISAMETAQDAAQQDLNEALQDQARLDQEIKSYQGKGQSVPQELADQYEANNQRIEAAKQSLAVADSNLDFTKKLVNMSEGIQDKLMDAKMQCTGTSFIESQAAFVDALTEAADDGTFTAEETANLATLAKGSNFSDSEVAGFASSLANSGMRVLDENDQEMTPEQIENLILSEWKEIQEEKAEVEQELDTTNAEIEQLQRQIQELQQTVDQEKIELAAAQEALQAEQQQTAQATQDAQSIQEVMSQYEDINDYMEQNYSMTVGVGPLSKQFGTGEDINVVGQDESRILKDNDGNFVYMSGEDQTLYTLAKNEDGSIKVENGEQVKVILSPEEALSLQSKMYSEKLVPRNFVANDAFAENSNDDGFYETLGRSFIGMEKGEQQANIDAALEQQVQEEQLAKQEQQKELEDLKTAENDVAQKSETIQSKEQDIGNLQEELARLQKRQEDLIQKAEEHNSELARELRDQSNGAEVLNADNTSNNPNQNSPFYENFGIRSEIDIAKQDLQVAQQRQMLLEQEINQYNDNNQEPPQELLDQLELAQHDVQNASENVSHIENKIEFFTKISGTSIPLPEKLPENASENDIARQNSIISHTEKQMAILDNIIEGVQSGTFSADQTSEIVTFAKENGYSEQEVAKLASDFANSGMTVLDESGNTLEPDQIENVIVSEWKENSEVQNARETETEWEGTEAPAPEADINEIELVDKIKNLSENSSISQEEFDAIIGDASPELREKIENVLANDGIEITPPENDQVANNNVTPAADEPSVAGNEPTPEQSPTLTVSYPAIGATAQVQVINAPKAEIPTNGVTPAIEYTSFADSPEFAATNDPKNPDATYAVPTNNHTNNVVDASDSFGKTLTVDQPQPAADGGLTPDQRATLEQQRIDQMRRNEELQQQNQLAQNDRATPSAGNTGMM